MTPRVLDDTAPRRVPGVMGHTVGDGSGKRLAQLNRQGAGSPSGGARPRRERRGAQR